MTAPRLEIDLDKIHHNARALVKKLAPKGISITGVTKATLGSPQIANILIGAGVRGLGDSRIGNIEEMRSAGVRSAITLIRSPMLSQVDRVVEHADSSCNTEIDVIRALSLAAQKAERTHGILLMVELGDLREGILPIDLEDVVRETLRLPNLTLEGIGGNLACQSGVVPDTKNMASLSRLADSLEATFGIKLATISGGNSANIPWALSGASTGRVNQLRLGEAILLGCEPLHRQPIEGLHTDAFTFVAEVIESKMKPSEPWGEQAQTAFGEPRPTTDRGSKPRTILAAGRQDIDSDGLSPPLGVELLGASSDHLVVSTDTCLPPGAELRFQLNYAALMAAMTSPFVAKVLLQEAPIIAAA